MIALIVSLSVIGGIFLIFAIVLVCPVIVDVQFQDSFLVKIKVLGIPDYGFSSKRKAAVGRTKGEKKEKEKPEEEEKKKQVNFLKLRVY